MLDRLNWHQPEVGERRAPFSAASSLIVPFRGGKAIGQALSIRPTTKLYVAAVGQSHNNPLHFHTHRVPGQTTHTIVSAWYEICTVYVWEGEGTGAWRTMFCYNPDHPREPEFEVIDRETLRMGLQYITLPPEVEATIGPAASLFGDSRCPSRQMADRDL